MAQPHCDYRTLLRLADGELGPLRAWCLRRHVRSCWQCRARWMDLEQHIRRARQALLVAPLPASQIERARLRFYRWEWSEGALLWKKRKARTVWAPAALAATVLLGFAGLFWTQREAADNTRRLLVALERADADLPRQAAAVRRHLDIEVRVGTQRTRPASVEILAEPATGRLAVRWRAPSGPLRYAVWRPAPGRGFRYQEGRLHEADSERHAALLEQLAQIPMQVQELEQLILDWICSRRWRPVSVAGEVRHLVEQGGAQIILRQKDDPAILTIQLGRRVNQRTLEVTLTLNEQTGRPGLETIRLIEGAQEAVIRLSPGRMEIVPVAYVHSNWFEPERAVLTALRPAPRPSRRVPPPEVPPATAPTEAHLANFELKVLAALHDEGLCVGEPIDVVRNGASLAIMGLVPSDAKRQALLARLGSLLAAGHIVVQLKTLEEAIAQAEGGGRQAAGAATVQPDQIRSPNPRVEPVLEASLRRLGINRPEEIAKRLTDFSNRALALAQEAMSQAWALRRLAERFPQSQLASMPPDALQTLERLARDHLLALSTSLAQAQLLWQEPLDPLGPQRATAIAAEGWSDLAGELFADIRQYDSIVHALLAEAKPELEPLETSLQQLAALLERSQKRTAMLRERLPPQPTLAGAKP